MNPDSFFPPFPLQALTNLLMEQFMLNSNSISFIRQFGQTKQYFVMKFFFLWMKNNESKGHRHKPHIDQTVKKQWADWMKKKKYSKAMPNVTQQEQASMSNFLFLYPSTISCFSLWCWLRWWWLNRLQTWD